jgi:hypothetical protein
MIENHMIDRPEGISRAFPISTFHSASVFAGTRARAREGPATIRGNLAQDEPGAKFGRSPRRSRYDPDISIFSFSETVDVQNFVEA